VLRALFAPAALRLETRLRFGPCSVDLTALESEAFTGSFTGALAGALGGPTAGRVGAAAMPDSNGPVTA
jgi:hypothetical protein